MTFWFLTCKPLNVTLPSSPVVSTPSEIPSDVQLPTEIGSASFLAQIGDHAVPPSIEYCSRKETSFSVLPSGVIFRIETEPALGVFLRTI